MKRNKEKKKADPVVGVLNVVIVIMVFVIIYAAFKFVFYWNFDRTSASFVQSASLMDYELSKNDYSGIIQGKYINEFNGITETKSYHALADYVEAASVYKVYDAKGYHDRASEQKAIMNKARIEMGELTVFADRMDRKFGIN